MPQAGPGTVHADRPLPVGSPLAPTAGAQRIVAIDVLRGVVLLGILVMNVSFMGWPEAWAMGPLRHPDGTVAERALWFVAEVFANMKMMSIFSLLFGAGIVMVADRAIAAGRSPAKLHYKRMVWLGVIGFIHIFFMWYGDILLTYAMVGALAYLMRRLPVRWLVGLGFGLLGIALLITLAFAGLFALWRMGDPAGYAELDMYSHDGVLSEVAAYRGGPVAQLRHRVPAALMMLLFVGPIMFYWWSGGMMLLGMAAMKTRLITGELSSAVYTKLLGLGLFVGLPMGAALAGYKLYATPASIHTAPGGITAMLEQSCHYLTVVPIVCGWIGGVLLLCKQPWFAKLSHPLACVGRMALTNYLSQTILVTFIFYGHGLGYFAKLQRPAMFGIVLGVWALQLAWSPLWLARFRYGPMEWLWRSLTYARLEPMRRRAAVVHKS